MTMADKARLDHSKPFGQVYGDAAYGATFEQFGRLFNNDGECVYEDERAIAASLKIQSANDRTKSVRRAELQAELAALNAAEASADNNAPNKAAESEVLGARMDQLTALEIKKLVMDAGLTPATGIGSKAKNIEALLALEGQRA
jgi:hypothetical protein